MCELKSCNLKLCSYNTVIQLLRVPFSKHFNLLKNINDCIKSHDLIGYSSGILKTENSKKLEEPMRTESKEIE